ncbi:MAG: zf-HC2 domain-containing protein [Armatimonadota bacterium]|nr:zf-HC2 domain-containing protein [Armatimonadota bacterium]MDR7542880.1 zf-HC2 domain-containing protein [Armatimonadota bacterium]
MHAHHRVEQQLSAYLDGELTPDRAAEVREHLAGCAACQADLQALRAVKRLLGALRAPEPAPDLEAAILARVERESRWLWLPRPRPAVALAAVALTVVLVAVPLVRGHRDRLRASEVSLDVFMRAAVQSTVADPFVDRAYIGLVLSDVDLRLAGEDPRAPSR